MKKRLQQLDRARAVYRHRRRGPVQVEPAKPRYHVAVGHVMGTIFHVIDAAKSFQFSLYHERQMERYRRAELKKA